MHSSTPTLITDQHPHCPHAHIYTLLALLAAFSAKSRGDLLRAVHECCRSSSKLYRPRLHAPIGTWNVSQVTDMAQMFYDIDAFNSELSEWDVSRVTDMRGMFANAIAFNQDLSKWDVSRVTSMLAMFRYTYWFNQDLSKWDVSRVTDMSAMFGSAKSFNQDLSKWDVSRVTVMLGMFDDASSFQQTLCGEAWVNSKASKEKMFLNSPGSISDTVCGAWMLW